jgi:hypothetical protein
MILFHVQSICATATWSYMSIYFYNEYNYQFYMWLSGNLTGKGWDVFLVLLYITENWTYCWIHLSIFFSSIDHCPFCAFIVLSWIPVLIAGGCSHGNSFDPHVLRSATAAGPWRSRCGRQLALAWVLDGRQRPQVWIVCKRHEFRWIAPCCSVERSWYIHKFPASQSDTWW